MPDQSLSFRLGPWHLRPCELPPSAPSTPPDDQLPLRCNHACLDYEQEAAAWTGRAGVAAAHPLLPGHFVDGKLVTRLVAAGRDAQGIPRPILAGQVGAGWYALDGASAVNARRVLVLNCEALTEADEASLAAAIRQATADRFELCAYRPPQARAARSCDFNAVQRLMYSYARNEMLRWEREVVETFGSQPVYADGRVRDHLRLEWCQLVIGVVKSLEVDFLHPHGHVVRDALAPGERTPAVLFYPDGTASSAVVTFYLRLAENGQGSAGGLIRVEVRQDAFEQLAQRDFGYLDAIAGHLHALRCLRPSYARAEVMTEPMYEVEQLIGAHFISPDLLALEAQADLFLEAL